MRVILFVVVLAVCCLAGYPTVPLDAASQSGAEQRVVPSGPAVNLNTATVEQLQRLPGIGPKTAARIVEYRQKNGGFKKIEEVMNIRGIGEKNFLKIKPQLSVTAPKVDLP